MHGRPREYKHKLKADPKAQDAYKRKVDAIRNGTALVLEYRRQKKYEPAILDAAAKLLKVVPEIYTLWNYRREALEPVFLAGGEAALRASDGELALTQSCLLENPKSYSTWHHRKWVVARGLAPLDRELQLISRALDEDPRNFHAWNYRQFICRRMGRSAEEELQYGEDKILQNFSNYSAWHFRTIQLHQMYCGGGGGDGGAAGGSGDGGSGETAAGAVGPGPLSTAAVVGAATRGTASQRTPIPHDVLDQEYDMVHQAFATDARDESPWMYYRWLVGNTLAHLGPQAASASSTSTSNPYAAAGTTRSSSGPPPQGAAAASSPPPPSSSPAAADQSAPPAAGTPEVDAEATAGESGTRSSGSCGGCGRTEQQQGKKEGQEADGQVEDQEKEAEEARYRVAAVLEREACRLQEDHLAAEPDAKWPLLTLARLREAQARLGLGGSPAECAAHLEEARSLYGRLMEVDPLRRGYYLDALEGRAFVVVQALGTV